MNEQVSPPTYPKCFHAGKGRRIKANGQSADCGSYKNSFPRYFLHFAFFSPPLGPCVRSLNVATDDDRLDRSAALNPRSLAHGRQNHFGIRQTRSQRLRRRRQRLPVCSAQRSSGVCRLLGLIFAMLLCLFPRILYVALAFG